MTNGTQHGAKTPPGGSDLYEEAIRHGWPGVRLAVLWPSLGLPSDLYDRLLLADPELLPQLVEAAEEDTSEPRLEALAITVGASPDDADLLPTAREIAELEFASTAIMRSRASMHPGTWLQARLDSIDKARLLFGDATAELRQVLDAVQPIQRMFDALEEAKQGHGPYHRTLVLRLHSFAAASVTLTDYVRRLATGTGDEELIDRARDIQYEPTAAFVRELRNLALHEGILPTRPFPRLGTGRKDIPGSITLTRDHLLGLRSADAWAGRPQAHQYLLDSEPIIHLEDIVQAHVDHLDAAVTEFLKEVSSKRWATIEQAGIYRRWAERLQKEIAIGTRPSS